MANTKVARYLTSHEISRKGLSLDYITENTVSEFHPTNPPLPPFHSHTLLASQMASPQK